MSDQGNAVDFVVSAYREDGRWQVEPLPPHLADDLDALVAVLRQRPGDGGALGLISIDEDFFIAVRVAGPDARFLLSDVTAATDWPVARKVLQRLGLPLPDDDDSVQPAGDTAIFADLGVEPMAVAAICDDIDSYPDEMLTEMATRMGFGPQFEGTLDNSYG